MAQILSVRRSLGNVRRRRVRKRAMRGATWAGRYVVSGFILFRSAALVELLNIGHGGAVKLRGNVRNAAFVVTRIM